MNTTNPSNSCNGPIVNLYAFTGAGCNNTDSNSESVSPFFSLTKFSAVPDGSAAPYRSECKRINAPGYKAASIVYSSDGANTGSCYLNLFDDDDCSGKRVNQYGLDDDVSACITADVRYARVYCNQQVRVPPLANMSGEFPDLTCDAVDDDNCRDGTQWQPRSGVSGCSLELMSTALGEC